MMACGLPPPTHTHRGITSRLPDGLQVLLWAKQIFFPGILGMSERCSALHISGAVHGTRENKKEWSLPLACPSILLLNVIGKDRQRGSGIHSELSLPFFLSVYPVRPPYYALHYYAFGEDFYCSEVHDFITFLPHSLCRGKIFISS